MLRQLIFFGYLVAVYAAQSNSCIYENTFGQSNDDSKLSQNSIILLGAAGDLTNQKLYPALWNLYHKNLLPINTKIFGYAQHQRTVDDLRKHVESYVTVNPGEDELYNEFWSLNEYINGTGNEDTDYEKLIREVDEFENGANGNRLFYLALEPSDFINATSQIKRVGMAKNGWTRIVIEKPFGYDFQSVKKLSQHLGNLFNEDHIYLNNYVLNDGIIQSILSLRFGNRMLTPAWNSENIAAIKIDLKDNTGLEGHDSSFKRTDSIRNIMQNQLLQIMSLIAMEKPKSNSADDIRNAKVESLKATEEIATDDVVLGQYVANPDSKVPFEKPESVAPTFALAVIKSRKHLGTRWKANPFFIMSAGKGLDINQTQIVIQFKNNETESCVSQPKRDQLVFILNEDDGLQAKITSKVPGHSDKIEEITLNFNYDEKHKDFGAHEKSILDVLRGSQLNFMRTDELIESWRIFSPVFDGIEDNKSQPIGYKFGTSGPTAAHEMEKKYNFFKTVAARSKAS